MIPGQASGSLECLVLWDTEGAVDKREARRLGIGFRLGECCMFLVATLPVLVFSAVLGYLIAPCFMHGGVWVPAVLVCHKRHHGLLELFLQKCGRSWFILPCWKTTDVGCDKRLFALPRGFYAVLLLAFRLLPVVGPLRMERAFFVHALIGVRPKQVTLSLD